MRYALVSDLHANLQAWNAVLLDIRSLKIDRIVCLGDIVGYGPNPAEVLRSVHSSVDHLVLGNHDAVIAGKITPTLFNEYALQSIRWTAGRLNHHAVRFLRTLPLTLDGDGFRCAHGDFSEPAAFNYVIEPPEALPSWQKVTEPLLFVGHTHRSAIFLLGASGTPRVVAPQDFEIEPGKRYLVNVGSIGQPRDGEARACYCIHDTVAATVHWRQVPFDLDAYRQALNAMGLSEETSYFLRHDPRIGTPPLRQSLNFVPATTPDTMAKGAIEVRELRVLRHHVRKWRTLSTVLLLAVIGIAGLTAGMLWRYQTRRKQIDAPNLTAIDASAAPSDASMLPAISAPVKAGAPLPGWSIRLGNRRKQQVSAITDANAGTVVVMSSETAADELALASPVINVTPGSTFSTEACVRESEPFSGHIALVLSLTKKVGKAESTIDQFLVKEPNLPRQGGWRSAKQTFEIPAGGCSLSYQIRGRFKGTASLKDLRLQRR